MFDKNQFITKRDKPEPKPTFNEIKSYLEKKLPDNSTLADLEKMAAGITAEICAAWETIN